MKIITGYDDAICDWLARVHGAYVLQTPRHILGVVDELNTLRGAFVITWHGNTTAELSVFGETSNDTVRHMFRAVFEVWGVHRLEIRTSRKNSAIKKAAPKFGFKFEGIARAFYGPGDDALVYAMTPDQCRWLKDHGKSLQIA